MTASNPSGCSLERLRDRPGQRPAREGAKGRWQSVVSGGVMVRLTATGRRLTEGMAASLAPSCFLAPRLQARSGQAYLFRQLVMHTWHGN